MAQDGLGVLIARMRGWNDKPDPADQAAIEGAVIESLGVNDNELSIKFENGYRLIILDEGQSCCEHRYMHTDDDLSYFVGAKITDVRTEYCEDVEDEYGGCTECVFLIVDTTKGSFTVANYNEHNGYYGGFAIHTKIERP